MPFCLSGCLGLSQKTSVAANVDGTVITEEQVTSYIEGFRDEDSTRETDDGWNKWLIDNGYTAESLRQYVIENVFIPKAVIRAQAKKKGFEVTDEELDAVIQSEKNYYEERYGIDTWSSVLASYGYDESSWRQNEEDRLLEERLKDKVIGNVKPTAAQLSSYGTEIAPTYNGKHSYFVAFDSQEEALRALEELGGEGASVKLSRFKKIGDKAAKTAAKAKQSGSNAQDDDQAPSVSVDMPDYELANGSIQKTGADQASDKKSTSTQVGDTPSYTQEDGMVNAGWGSLKGSIGNENKIYSNALNSLQEKTISGLLDMQNGAWVIAYCDDVFVADKSSDFDYSSAPKAIAKQVKADVYQRLQDEAFEKWLSKKTNQAAVSIKEMPDTVSYNVSS